MFHITYLPEHLKKPLEILGKRYHFKIGSKGRIIKFIPTQQNILKIECSQTDVSITAPILPAFFRGIGIVVEEEQKNHMAFSSEEEIWFDLNGLMLDCSRNGVVSISYAKELIEQLAIMGHNTFMLYMEDVYEVENEVYFGYLRGRYSRSELQELDDYASLFGIELIPCVQTLAHLDQFLSWDTPGKSYVDIDNILNVGDPKVKELLERMISQLSKTFHSRRIHIGMDEAYHLGRGRYADACGFHSRREIMAAHLQFMVQLCQKYGLHPIIWDDMFFHYQADQDPILIPDGIDVMYWDYYHNTEAEYEENFELRCKVVKNIMFAGGAWRWIGYTPHHSKTLVTSHASLTICKKRGIREVIVTSWADDGCECPVSACLFGCVLFAEHQYHKEVDMKTFQNRLKFLTGIDYETFMRQEAFDIFPSFIHKEATVTPSKYTFYEDPLCSLFVPHTQTVADDLTSHYQSLASYFEQEAAKTSDPVLQATHHFFSVFGRVMSLKWNLGLNIYKAYQAGDRSKMSAIIQKQISPLIPLMEQLEEARRNEWYLVNKSFGFEVLDHRIGGVIQRLKTSQFILQQYLTNQIDSIPELEEPRIPVTNEREQGMGEVIHFNQALKSMTPSRMGW